MAVALGKVASREEAHGAQQRDRDRAAIVKDRILAQTVDPDGQSLGRALHRHEVVHACLRGWWFDPSAANLKAVGALEHRERGAALVCKRAGAGLAQRAQAMIARAVVDLERDVDSPLARVERDFGPDRAIDELG